MALISRKYFGPNHFWASLFIEELARCGVRHFVVAPGGQSTLLVMAVDENPLTEAVVSHDERGAAFYALGYGRAKGEPCAVISTSGTAVANFAPAVMEADAGKDPLLLLTADLPEEMHDSGVNQSVEQCAMFSSYLRWSFDFSAPDKHSSIPAMLTAADQAVSRMTASHAGPVQLNCRFRPPLLLSDSPTNPSLPAALDSWAQSLQPYTTYPRSDFLPPAKEISNLSQVLARAKRGLLLIGQLPCNTSLEPLFELIQQLGWPVLPAITSGMRFSMPSGDQLLLCVHYATYLALESFRKGALPDVVFHIGGDLIQHVGTEPFNNALNTYIRESSASYIMLQSHLCRQDPLQKVSQRLTGNIERVCEQLVKELPKSSSQLTDLYQGAERETKRCLARFVEQQAEQRVIPALITVLKNLPEEGGLFLANSLSIRAVDLLASTSGKNISVASHHGAKGIDGTLAAAVGFAVGLHQVTTLVTGDIALLHDLNSLLLAKSIKQPFVIVVINDDGGSIFSYVPASDIPQFTKYFLTPHGRTFLKAAEFFDIPYMCPEDTEQFEAAYCKALKTKGVSLIELCVTRAEILDSYRELFEAVHRDVAVVS